MAKWQPYKMAEDVFYALYPKLNAKGISLAIVTKESERYKYLLNIYNGGDFGKGFVRLDPKRCERVLKQYFNNVQYLVEQDNRYLYLCSGKKFRTN